MWSGLKNGVSDRLLLTKVAPMQVAVAIGDGTLGAVDFQGFHHQSTSRGRMEAPGNSGLTIRPNGRVCLLA